MSDLLTRLSAALPRDTLYPPDRLATRDPGVFPANLDAPLGVAPRTVSEVQTILEICRDTGTPIVPQGGRTGLTEAAIGHKNALLLFSHNLTQTLDIDPISQVATLSAGHTLAMAEAAARQHGLTLGIDLAARDSATIGGMISTNAGGMEAFRNGVMRDRVLGLEAVLPDGTHLSDLAQVRKCNEGYDVKQLLIGAEGTLGIVTAATIALLPAPPAAQTALIALSGIDAALTLFHGLQADPELTLLRAEVIWPEYTQAIARVHGHEALLTQDTGLYLVLDLHSATQSIEDSLTRHLTPMIEDGTLLNATLAQNHTQAQNIWILREDTQSLATRHSINLWFDVTIPLAALAAYTEQLESDLAQIHPNLTTYIIGHLGDGNLHISVCTNDTLTEDQTTQIKAAVMAPTKPLGGSFSAEHGIGREKRAALISYGDPGKRALMKQIKAVIDPQNICNPGVIF